MLIRLHPVPCTEPFRSRSFSSSLSEGLPGQRVIGFSSPMHFFCTSGLNGFTVAPYFPNRISFVSFVTILYLSPMSTLNTACVPTICEDGVTSGGSPRSLRTHAELPREHRRICLLRAVLLAGKSGWRAYRPVPGTVKS